MYFLYFKPTSNPTQTSENITNLMFLPLVQYFNYFTWFSMKNGKISLVGNQKCRKNDLLNSVQSFLKSHLFWLTLELNIYFYVDWIVLGIVKKYEYGNPRIVFCSFIKFKKNFTNTDGFDFSPPPIKVDFVTASYIKLWLNFSISIVKDKSKNVNENPLSKHY